VRLGGSVRGASGKVKVKTTRCQRASHREQRARAGVHHDRRIHIVKQTRFRKEHLAASVLGGGFLARCAKERHRAGQLLDHSTQREESAGGGSADDIMPAAMAHLWQRVIFSEDGDAWSCPLSSQLGAERGSHSRDARFAWHAPPREQIAQQRCGFELLVADLRLACHLIAGSDQRVRHPINFGLRHLFEHLNLGQRRLPLASASPARRQ